MKFTKMQGCGNDYIYVNCFEETVRQPEQLAPLLADRHYGIGGDGLILIEPSERADAFMHMFNLDGSEGSMCGNGIRCVAKFLYDHGLIPPDRRTALIDTRAGLREVRLEIREGKAEEVTVDMGKAALTGSCPETIRVQGPEIRFIGIDIGNPHAVCFLEDNPELVPAGAGLEEAGSWLYELPIRGIGMAMERQARFPDGVNTEFIAVQSPQEILFRVWERGSGETLACGTGAAAAVAAGNFAGKLEEEVLVHLRGGDLRIRFDRQTGRCRMTGPAREVFSGEIDLSALRAGTTGPAGE